MPCVFEYFYDISLTLFRRVRVCFPFLVLVAACSAQVSAPGSDVARPIPGSGHDYIHLLAETVNPANGSLSINIALPTPAGRGISIPYSITYNSGSVHHLISAAPGFAAYVPASNSENSVGGWSNTLPYVTANFWQVGLPTPARNTGSCTFSDNYVFYDSSGVSHFLGLTNTSPFHDSEGGPVDPNYCSSISPSNNLTGSDDEVTAQQYLTCDGRDGGPASCRYATAPFTVITESGTVYTFPYTFGGDPGIGHSSTEFAYPYTIEDSNGNIIGVNTSHGTTTPTYIDTLGRTIVSTTGTANPGNSQTITVGGLSYTVTYTTSTANFSQAVHAATQPASGVICGTTLTVPNNGVVPNGPGDSGTPTVIHSITLPNGKQYNFNYESQFGLLSEIDYPDGGWVKYTWKFSDTLSDLIEYGGSTGGLCFVQYQTPVIGSRTVGFTGDPTAAQTQTFTYNTAWIGQPPQSVYWSAKTTTVKTLDVMTGLSATNVYTYGSVPAPTGREPGGGGTTVQLPVETSIKYYAWNTDPGPGVAPLRTVNKTWNDPFQMTSEQTVLENGVSTETVRCFAGTQLAEEDVYDYGVPSPSFSQGDPAPFQPPVSSCRQLNPSRKTIVTFQNFAGANITPQDPVLGPIASPVPIFPSTFIKPCQVRTYDTGSAPASETDLYYDGASSLCSGTPSAPWPTGVGNLAKWQDSTGAQYPTHDEGLFGTNSTNARGNVSKIVKLSNSGTSSATTYIYDETGQITSMTDPCGNATCSDMTGTNHTTTYSYIDSPTGGNSAGQSNAYVTQITSPSVNNIAQSNSFAYNYVTGSLASSTDANVKNTVYSYNDSLDRLTGITYPDGGNVTISYSDTASSSLSLPSCPSSSSSPLPPAPSMTTSQFLSSTEGTKTTVAVRDGMGHIVQTQLTSDPAPDCVDTVYNGMGQAQSISNPHRSSASPSTDGLTTYSYDPLGRVLSLTHPDHLSLKWLYNGNVTTSSDENGNSWVRTTDALGRLTNVVEPNSALTSYTYNPMGDLTKVQQSGVTGEAARTRSFTYDSLSRLACASNPENSSSPCPLSATTALPSGVIGYSYDLNGNVSSKIDARGITIAYTYDALNRVTSKQYSGGSFATPSSCFLYDKGSGQTVTNGTGRLIQEWTQNGACDPASDKLTQRSMTSYDAMGRLQTEQRCILANCKISAVPFSLTRTYDYAGNLQTYDNGLGTLTITNTYDGANRLFQVGSSVNDAILYYISGFTPNGASASSMLGGNISVTQMYDLRLRPTSLLAVKQ